MEEFEGKERHLCEILKDGKNYCSCVRRTYQKTRKITNYLSKTLDKYEESILNQESEEKNLKEIAETVLFRR